MAGTPPRPLFDRLPPRPSSPPRERAAMVATDHGERMAAEGREPDEERAAEPAHPREDLANLDEPPVTRPHEPH